MKMLKLLLCGVALTTLISTSHAETITMGTKDDTMEIKSLTPIQDYVTQHGGTEKAFDNEFWNHKEDGIYVDIISGEPLFSSVDKFDSGTGWPSFSKPITDNALMSSVDKSHGMTRTEVKSKGASSHLGHVFNDGPKDKGGMRYCINSASLRFIPKEHLVEEGYGDYLSLFK